MLQQRLVNDTLLISPRALTNNATATANFDTKGANYATIRVCMSSEVNTNAVGPTLVLSESDDTVVSNFATLDTESAVDLTAAREVFFGVDLRARKRYLRIAVTTPTATNDHIVVAAVGTLSDLENAPNGTTGVADQVVFV
jgi:hypothetical protein